ncbi:Mitochondrial distribution and morphology protein 35 [Hypsizygus marmoreus]|uniref:Mitochondrial distribution and morphology protein 35 n=1 Tax=Hypsizygus marmoreus TaxID=39966 RepID=A0A369K899_HYPMA|nr:Mitochondrial distribution and morphology protein 35 [Hypsizygus marmoreus]
MAHSLSPECTPLKLEYDACFNAWFEGYLEPAVAASASTAQREAYSHRKAAEFQEKCGKVWESYRLCVQKAVKDKGLEALLQQARDENPLTEAPPPPSTAGKSSS